MHYVKKHSFSLFLPSYPTTVLNANGKDCSWPRQICLGALVSTSINYIKQPLLLPCVLSNRKVGTGPGICGGLLPWGGGKSCHSPACHPAQVGEPSSNETHRSQDVTVSAHGGIHQSCLLVCVHSHGWPQSSLKRGTGLGTYPSNKEQRVPWKSRSWVALKESAERESLFSHIAMCTSARISPFIDDGLLAS